MMEDINDLASAEPRWGELLNGMQTKYSQGAGGAAGAFAAGVGVSEQTGRDMFLVRRLPPPAAPPPPPPRTPPQTPGAAPRPFSPARTRRRSGGSSSPPRRVCETGKHFPSSSRCTASLRVRAAAAARSGPYAEMKQAHSRRQCDGTRALGSSSPLQSSSDPEFFSSPPSSNGTRALWS
jgi:hypothetical protein